MARTRSRKRRPSGGARSARQAGEAKHAQRVANAPAKVRQPRSSPAAPTYGERPPAPWHPLPLSEILILVGALVAVFGFKAVNHEGSAGAPTLIAGIAAVAIGTFEVTLREHRSGYRSHTVMLALAPVLVLDSLIVLVISLFTTAPRLLSVGLLALDIALFAFFFRLLRARFLAARHARVLKEG
ncbi:MAG TPA: hypothetical protein VK756_03045 [Solirubrobacteraceae bacterium]|jgi:hypothetical protein|nr:hypothetical protein [Solirubrobacteraceae bacterium]